MKVSLSRLKEICNNGNYTYIVGTDNFNGLDPFSNDLIIHQKYDKVVVIFNPNIVYFVSDNGCIGIQHIKEIEYKRSLDDSGEIYMMEFTGTGCEQTGWRPGVVFQNNIGNTFSPNIIALPLTTAIKKYSQPTHVLISSKDSGIRKDSIVLCENPQRMSKRRIGNYITTLSDKYMSMIAKASLIATSAIAFVDPDDLLSIWQKALSLNKP